MSEEEVQYIDAETDFRGGQGNSIKEIVMTHISRIGNICTKEFKKGYWEKRPVKVGDAIHIIEKYQEDTRDAYVNAVDFLHDVLLARFDKEATTNINLIELEIESLVKDVKVDEETFKNNRLKLRRKIFRELSLLLQRLNYLDTGYISD